MLRRAFEFVYKNECNVNISPHKPVRDFCFTQCFLYLNLFHIANIVCYCLVFLFLVFETEKTIEGEQENVLRFGTSCSIYINFLVFLLFFWLSRKERKSKGNGEAKKPSRKMMLLFWVFVMAYALFI